MNEDFRYIAAIAEYGSISKAARVEHISQPGLSQRLKRLEEQMGTELFDRSAMPLKPTPSGEVYLRYAKRALAAEQDMRRDVYSAATKRRRTLRVGVSTARADNMLSEVLVSFYESHRGCAVTLRELATFEQLHDLFLGDEIDFAVLTPIAPDPQFYETQVLLREQLVVAARTDFEAPQLASAQVSGAVGIRQLEGMPLVLPTCGRYFDPLVTRMIGVANAQLDIVVSNCSTELALGLVEDGICAAIVPSTSLIGHGSLQQFQLEDTDAGNMLRYIRRRDRHPLSEERLFMDLLKRWLSENA